MNIMIILLGIAISLLAALNTVFWGYAIKEVGSPRLSLGFAFNLIFNKWFILAMVTAFIASILSYIILRELGILIGRFFLSLQSVAIVLASILVLREQPTMNDWIGIALIIMGVMLLGRR